MFGDNKSILVLEKTIELLKTEFRGGHYLLERRMDAQVQRIDAIYKFALELYRANPGATKADRAAKAEDGKKSKKRGRPAKKPDTDGNINESML